MSGEADGRAIRSVGVFCAARAGARAEFADAARAFGRLAGERGLRLVYGGGSRGLMGAVADGALEAGAEVIGVIPRMLVTKELAHEGVSEMRVVSTMMERKALIMELSDAFVALPGGLGTLDEVFEAVTFAQLGLARKPTGFLNVLGYWDAQAEMLRRGVEEGFIAADSPGMAEISDDADGLLTMLERRAAAMRRR